MSDKIILGELEKLLFPERYPYYNSHFNTERELLSDGNLSDISYQNINFKIKVARYSLNVKDEDSRMMLNYVFQKHVEAYYDWHKEYDWYELKSILLYFLVFNQVQNSKEIFNLFKNNKLRVIFEKYLPLLNLQKV